jgi:2',3'-cyclic-nucleotide 2'-phosphodiesterase (5'-nucleotidase family)
MKHRVVTHGANALLLVAAACIASARTPGPPGVAETAIAEGAYPGHTAHWRTDGSGEACEVPVSKRRFKTVGPACDLSATAQTLTFVHVSDLHARYTPDGHGNPYSRLKGYAESVRRENPFTLFTNGGDDHEKGSIAEPRSGGLATLQVVHAMGFDVRVLGNHDFAWQLDELLEFSRDPRAITLCSNVEHVGSPAAAFGAVDYAEAQVGCLRVGFFGMVTRPWQANQQQYTGSYYEELPARYDFVVRAREIVRQHRDQVDLLVMVSHLGHKPDVAIAEQVPGIDLVLGGHSHALWSLPKQVGSALVIQPGSKGRHAARLDLQFELPARRRLAHAFRLVENRPDTMPSDPSVERVANQVLGDYAPDALHSVAWLRGRQSRVGIARLAARAAVSELPVDAAVVAPGGVRSDWRAGGLSPQKMLDALSIQRHPPGTPGDTSFYTATVRGADLQRLREERSSWAYSGPDSLSHSATYRLALQKYVAVHAHSYLPSGLALEQPVFSSEGWEVLLSFAQRRTAGCAYLDQEAALPICAVARMGAAVGSGLAVWGEPGTRELARLVNPQANGPG